MAHGLRDSACHFQRRDSRCVGIVNLTGRGRVLLVRAKDLPDPSRRATDRAGALLCGACGRRVPSALAVEPSADPETSGSVQKFARLSAGGRWIRTSSTRARQIWLSPLLCSPGARAARTQARVAAMLATCSCYRVYPRTNDALHCAETAYRSGDDPPSHR
jgi:hypothetical protein